MKIYKSLVSFFLRFTTLYFTVPLTTLAQTLVPACGATSLGGYTQEYQYLAATSCNFCWLAQLVQNIVNFLIMVSIPISIALFAWAGILFFTSAANPKGIGRAKKIFMSVLIGFAIALSGWVLVQVLLQTITNSTFYESTATWFKLDCKQYDKARPRNKTLNQVLGTLQAVGAPPTPATTPAPDVTSSASGGSSGANVPTVITNNDGTQTIMTGGSIAWRNNNPGNMISGIPGYPSIGSNAGFAVFPDYQTGFDAMVANLQTREYQAKTVAGALQMWAPGGGVENDPGGINNPAAYAAFVQKETGIPANTPINSLNREQLVQVGNAIQKMEGYIPGKVISR